MVQLGHRRIGVLAVAASLAAGAVLASAAGAAPGTHGSGPGATGSAPGGSAPGASGRSLGFTAPSRADDPAISAKNPKYVNEPATAVGSDGARYVAYQRGSQLSVTRDGGRTWSYVGGSNAASVLSRNTTG